MRCPTLVIVGAEDATTTPAMAGEMCAAIAGARLEIARACAHLLCAEAPAAFDAVLLPFLREHARRLRAG